MSEPQDPIMRHMLGYIRGIEKAHPDGVEHGRIVLDARDHFPDETLGRIDDALRLLYVQGYIERRYNGNYEIPEH